MTEQRIEFRAATSGERLDKLIVAHTGERLSRAQIQTFIKEGLVTVDGAQVKAGVRLRGGELISLTLPEKHEAKTVQPEAIPLAVLYEDKYLAVIDKPAGMIVHPGLGNESGTLVAAMLARWPEVAAMNIEEKRAGIIHRLDKDTSGLIVVARRDSIRRKMAKQFQDRTVEKTYLALLEKKPPTPTGRIDAPISRDPNQRKRMAVVRGGKPAVTEYTVIEQDFAGDRVLVKVNLLTGRTHQIRVHMAFIGCPIVGDHIYGYRKQRLGIKRQFLHAAALAFDHPVTGERLRFESPLPSGLQNILDKLREK